ncbi:MAG: DUF4271 domain-containing protein, partial [Cyclobacteriaceae bacterium]|nr:DUF4271 domain-containing protein [Cyclobacteriaceae bacterium]
MKRYFFFLLVLCALPGFGQHEVSNLNSRLYHFNNGEKVYSEDSKTLHFDLKRKEIRSFPLRIQSSGDVFVFINNTLFKKGKELLIHERDLNSGNSFLLTIYRFDEDNDLKIGIGELAIFAPPEGQLKDKRIGYGYNNFINIVFVVFLFVFSVVKVTLGRDVVDFFKLGFMFSSRNRDENIFRNRLMSPPTLAFIIIYSLIISFLILVVQEEKYISESLGYLIGNWLLWTLALIVLLFLKSGLIRLFLYIFNISKVFPFHFYNYLRISVVLLMVTALFALLLSWTIPFYNSKNFIVYALIFGAFLRALFVFLKLNSEVGYKNFHLFSYLCATELLPFFWIVFIG